MTRRPAGRRRREALADRSATVGSGLASGCASGLASKHARRACPTQSLRSGCGFSKCAVLPLRRALHARAPLALGAAGRTPRQPSTRATITASTRSSPEPLTARQRRTPPELGSSALPERGAERAQGDAHALDELGAVLAPVLEPARRGVQGVGQLPRREPRALVGGEQARGADRATDGLDEAAPRRPATLGPTRAWLVSRRSEDAAPMPMADEAAHPGVEAAQEPFLERARRRRAAWRRPRRGTSRGRARPWRRRGLPWWRSAGTGPGARARRRGRSRPWRSCGSRSARTPLARRRGSCSGAGRLPWRLLLSY